MSAFEDKVQMLSFDNHARVDPLIRLEPMSGYLRRGSCVLPSKVVPQVEEP